MTFGNAKIITNKAFRPSYGIAEGQETKVLRMPVKVIEQSIQVLANSGENKEKSDFFNQFQWYVNYSAALRTKFNNMFTKKTFYPG